MEALSISAVIPTYNRGALVARAVESALRQTKPPAEIIVVDDGSQDDTRDQIARFGDRVRYIYQENAGSAVARNHGMRLATHEWVALLDSDDMWVESHLANMARAICETDGAAAFYFANTQEPPDKGGCALWEKLDFAIDGPFELAADGTDWVMMRRQPIMLQSAVFRKDAFWHAGGFLPALRYRDDTHLFLKLGLGQPICAVDGCGVQMTSDDDPANRLTLNYDRQTRGFCMQVIMNRDLLQTMPDLPQETQDALRVRLGDAYRALARHAWREGHYTTAVQNASRSAFAAPALFIKRGLRKFGLASR